MLQRWVDHNGDEHRVKDDYERNCVLVDLKAQPDNIKAKINECITANSEAKAKPMVGAQFLKFCGKFNLQKLSDQSANFGEVFSAPYQG
jgi:hypothetical protein